MTTKLLLVGDAGKPTGFEKVLRHVCEHLHSTGRYDLVIRGVGYFDGDKHEPYPCEVKATGGNPDYPVGVLNFADWVEEDKPDVVWTVQDLWNILGFCLGKPK